MQAVNWGVIGIGRHFILRVLLPMQKTESVNLCGVSSRDAAKAEDTAKSYNIPRWYGSYDDLLRDGDIEAVYIPLPNNMHLEWIKKAADAGKHILCEKPLALTTAEAEEAFDYTEKNGVLLMEAFMYRFHPQWIRVGELVRTGAIGNVRAVHTVFSYMNTNPSNIRNKSDLGGGAIYDIGCYGVSTARYIFGGEPGKVFALMKRDEAFGIDMLTSAVLDFGDGHAVFSMCTQMDAWQKVDIHGTSGTIRVDVPFNAYDDVPVTLTVWSGIGVREIPCGPADQFGAEFNAFSRVVRDGGQLPISREDTLGNMRVIDALFASGETDSWKTVG